jgi:hypothetical protein
MFSPFLDRREARHRKLYRGFLDRQAIQPSGSASVSTTVPFPHPIFDSESDRFGGGFASDDYRDSETDKRRGC